MEEEGQFGSGAETLLDDRMQLGRDEREDLGDGIGEALAGGVGVGCVLEMGVQVAVVGGVTLDRAPRSRGSSSKSS